MAQRQPFSLKQIFARMLVLLTGPDGTGIPAAATEDGALKVFLEEDNASGTTVTRETLDLQLELLLELKRIRVLLSVIADEEVSAEEASREE